MEWYNIVITILTILAIPTLFGLIWKDIYEKEKKKSAKNQNRRDQEELDTLRRVIQEEITPLKTKIDEMDKKLGKDSNGTLCTLRNDILRCYYECLQKGYRNDFDYTNIHDLDEAYKALNGNSFVADVMHRFDLLLTEEEFDQKKNGKNARIEKGNDDKSK